MYLLLPFFIKKEPTLVVVLLLLLVNNLFAQNTFLYSSLPNVLVFLRHKESKEQSLSFVFLLLSLSQRTAMEPNQHRVIPPTKTTILTAFLTFIAMVLVISSSPSFKNGFSIVHKVPEGHVGVYWRGDALLQTITEPGFHLKMPFVTKYEHVQVTYHTDTVADVACVTKGGVLIYFDKIHVANRLHEEYVYDTLLNYGVHYDKTWIHDKIHHEINRFCTSHTLQQVYIDAFDQIGEKMKDALQADCARYAPGVEIISVHVLKPTLPDTIRRNFEQLEEERIKVLIAVERQKVAKKEAETMMKIAISEAERDATVSKILMEWILWEKESCRLHQEVENQMFLELEKSKADAFFYRATKEAEANKLKLTPEFLQLKFIETIADITNNTSFSDKRLKMA